MSGKSNPRSSGRESAQTSRRKKDQSRLTSAATKLHEDPTPYRIASSPAPLTEALGYQVYGKIINAQSVVPQHRQRLFLVGFKPGRAFAFPEFPAEGPRLTSILDPDVPNKYTLTDHLRKTL